MTFHSAFFEISAQLIPVLFLAMVVEDKLQQDEAPWERVLRSFALVLLAGSEAACLAVVAGSLAGSVATGRSVAAVMVLAGLIMVSPAIGRELTSERSRTERMWHAGAVLLFLAGAICLVLVIAL
jgi:hypothetical protein